MVQMIWCTLTEVVKAVMLTCDGRITVPVRLRLLKLKVGATAYIDGASKRRNTADTVSRIGHIGDSVRR